MWKFIFYSRLNLDAAEKKLRILEQSGYRTDRVLMRYWFHFKEGSTKQTDYFFTMSFPKEYGMSIVCDKLKKEYNAVEIDCKWMGVVSWTLWRATTPLDDRKMIEELRGSYLIHIINQELLLSSFLLSMSFVMLLDQDHAPSRAGVILSWAFLSTFLVFFLWRLIERVCLRGRSK